MAKVKIQGHASGSGILTVTAPNTSSDRTITLPDATGTLLNSDGDGSSLTGLFDPDGAVVFNDSHADVDFRVESDTSTHALFVDGEDGWIGMGTDAQNNDGYLNVEAPTTSYCISSFKTPADNSANYAVFLNAGTLVGRVQGNGATTVNYATSSDYRLKENVNYDFDATTRLKQLKPARFNFIADETNTLFDGFIAHEVSSIVPEAISGAKDALNSDGNIDPQGIDLSKLVPLLVKTIQELEARITALEA